MFASTLLPPSHLALSSAGSRRHMAVPRQKNAISIASVNNRVVMTTSEMQKPKAVAFDQSSVLGQTIHLGRSLGFRPSPELGLLSIVFVLSMAIGAIFSLVLISIPTMNAFRVLSASVDRLSKAVSEELPGTLSSLKLSLLEINDLTQQLSNLRLWRQKIPGNQFGKVGGRRIKPRSNPGRNGHTTS